MKNEPVTLTLTLTRRQKLDIINTLSEQDIQHLANTCHYEIVELIAHYCSMRVGI